MTNKVKKAIAGLMATASLATGIVGMSANATDASRSFGNGATAYLSVSSNSVYAYTKKSTAGDLYVHVYNFGSYTNGWTSDSGEDTTKVVANVWGGSYSFSNSEHKADSTWLSPDMAVWR